MLARDRTWRVTEDAVSAGSRTDGIFRHGREQWLCTSDDNESRHDPRYRIEHHGDHRASGVLNHHATLAAALIEVAIVRRWLAAAGAPGTLVVIDGDETPEQRVSS